MPVTVTVPLVEEEALNVHVEVRLEPPTVPGIQAVVMPEGEETVSVTVPVNPPMGESVIVEEPVPPAVNATSAGLALSPKSGEVELVAVTAIDAE